MREITTIRVYATPGPQGSKTARPVKRNGVFTGQVNQVESSKKVKPWRAAIVEAWKRESLEPLEGAVAVEVVFYIQRPKSHYGTGRNARVKKDTAPKDHTQKPDLDKLVRATLDGLDEAGAFVDDSQVTRLLPQKEWTEVLQGYEEGAVITVHGTRRATREK